MKPAAFFCVCALAISMVAASDLGITPRIQETYVWCWVAVGQMVFEHFDIPNVNPAGDYQCGIVGLLAVGTIREDCAYRCQNCTVPAGSATSIVRMIEDYPKRVAFVGNNEVPRLRATYLTRALSIRDLKEELDNERPIIAGISPSGRPARWVNSEHVALIVGTDDTADRELLLVNDPYPFGSGWPNPYERAGAVNNGNGSYWISYSAFLQRLQWHESILVRQIGVIPATPKGDGCCFVGPYGRDFCPLNLTGPLPLGTICTCNYPAARFVGKVCNPRNQ